MDDPALKARRRIMGSREEEVGEKRRQSNRRKVEVFLCGGNSVAMRRQQSCKIVGSRE
jgi:hypothetical protein